MLCTMKYGVQQIIKLAMMQTVSFSVLIFALGIVEAALKDLRSRIVDWGPSISHPWSCIDTALLFSCPAAQTVFSTFM